MIGRNIAVQHQFNYGIETRGYDLDLVVDVRIHRLPIKGLRRIGRYQAVDRRNEYDMLVVERFLEDLLAPAPARQDQDRR